MNHENLEKQVDTWSNIVSTVPQTEEEILKVIAECMITQTMLIYNIDENIKLIQNRQR